MPYSQKQHAVFRAIAHGFKPDEPSLASISPAQAGRMADEGVKGGGAMHGGGRRAFMRGVMRAKDHRRQMG